MDRTLVVKPLAGVAINGVATSEQGPGGANRTEEQTDRTTTDGLGHIMQEAKLGQFYLPKPEARMTAEP